MRRGRLRRGDLGSWDFKFQVPARRLAAEGSAGVEIDEDFAGAGAVFGADDSALFELFHQAGRAIITDTETALEHGSGGPLGTSEHIDGIGQELVAIGGTAIVTHRIITPRVNLLLHVLGNFRRIVILFQKLDDRLNFVVRGGVKGSFHYLCG